MIVVVSPHELTARTPTAIAALTLATQVVTLLPTPLEGADPQSIRQAMDRSPRFSALMQNWRWMAPLWRETVLASSFNAQTPLDDVLSATERINADPALAPLAALVSRQTFQSTDTYLDALCQDLLRGGGNPTITIPVTAGLERFAARHALITMSSPAPSLAGRIEAKGVSALARIGVPLFTRAGATLILRARESLGEPLAALRESIDRLHALVRTSPAPEPVARLVRDDLEPRARTYEAAFLAQRQPLIAQSKDDDDQPVEGPRAHHLSLSFGLLEPATALTAATHAARRAIPAAGRRPGQRPETSDAPETALATRRAMTIAARVLPWDV